MFRGYNLIVSASCQGKRESEVCSKSGTGCKNDGCSAKGICHRSSVVYLATCSLCKESYVRMTTRKFHDRAREHLNSAKTRLNKTAIGDHYREKHPKGTTSLSFRILAYQRNALRLHIEEAMAINKLKSSLNRRQETMGTGFLI